MTLSSLLYVSRSTIEPARAELAVGEIVDVAVERNLVLGLTGTLLFTGSHFAQVLEGEAASLDTIMTSIRRDPRHQDIKVVANGPLNARRFPDWRMAYFGPSQFVSRHVLRLLRAPSPVEQGRAAKWLTELLREFSTA